MKRIPTFVLLGAVPLVWGMNFHLARYCVQHLPPNTVGSIRFIIATLLLLPLFLALERPKWPSLKPHLVAMAVVGATGVFGYNYLFFKAMQTTSPTNASLLLAFNPLATLLLSTLWLKKEARPLQWVGVTLGMAGVLLIVTRGELQALLGMKISYGEILLLLVALSFAFANIIVRKYLQSVSSLATSTVSTIVGTLLLLAVAWFEPHPAVPFTATPLSVWLALFFMTMGGSIIGYIAWNHSVAKVGAEKAALFMNLTPFYTVLIALCMGQPVELLQLLGGGCIVSGIVMANLQLKRKAAKPMQVSSS
ncbi:DMT family transporter [Pontibacter sp. MBLB2868]|uniref:DMT family transporter n=1 Tax=Pontibacter sp. MBLB2868 TaxID=3451555 RepID=UPI003F74C9A3